MVDEVMWCYYYCRRSSTESHSYSYASGLTRSAALHDPPSLLQLDRLRSGPSDSTGHLGRGKYAVEDSSHGSRPLTVGINITTVFLN